MPPRLYSRYQFCDAINDENGVLYLTEREPYGYQNLSDNRVVIAKQGDTLFTLAARYFAPLPNAAKLWWVIADFQPSPIFDPTVGLANGQQMIIPSLRTVTDRIFNESRRFAASEV